jgi:hypothetical protein
VLVLQPMKGMRFLQLLVLRVHLLYLKVETLQDSQRVVLDLDYQKFTIDYIVSLNLRTAIGITGFHKFKSCFEYIGHVPAKYNSMKKPSQEGLC